MSSQEQQALERQALEQKAVELALQASRSGYPAPNPRVGCTIVKNGEIIATGYHDHAGGPHAEIDALQKAGSQAEGATVYVTLEPCNGTGRTPPCSKALIKAKVAKVAFIVPDPNPKMAGGQQALNEAGIECVQLPQYLEQAEAENRIWLTSVRRQSPFIALKAAVSLDGRIALPSGESQWITSPESRQATHALRAEYGAVLVGRKTAEIDNPRLTARIHGVVNQPTRIVIDLDHKLSPHLQIFNNEAPTLQVVRQAIHPNQIEAATSEGYLDLPELMRQLFDQGIVGILVEGGAQTLANFVQAGLGDRLHLFIAPKLLGAGPSWLDNIGLKKLEEAPVWQKINERTHGPDTELVLEPLQNPEIFGSQRNQG